jgi:hypothetical protein
MRYIFGAVFLFLTICAQAQSFKLSCDRECIQRPESDVEPARGPRKCQYHVNDDQRRRIHHRRFKRIE